MPMVSLYCAVTFMESSIILDCVGSVTLGLMSALLTCFSLARPSEEAGCGVSGMGSGKAFSEL